MNKTTSNETANKFYQEFIKTNVINSKKFSNIIDEQGNLKDHFIDCRLKHLSRGAKIIFKYLKDTKPKYSIFSYKNKNANKLQTIQQYSLIIGNQDIPVRVVEPTKKNDTIKLQFSDVEMNDIIETFISTLKPVRIPNILEEKVVSACDGIENKKNDTVEKDIDEPKKNDQKNEKKPICYKDCKISEIIDYIRGFYRYDKPKYKSMLLNKQNKAALNNLCTFHNIDLDSGKKYHDIYSKSFEEFNQLMKKCNTPEMLKKYQELRLLFPIAIGKFIDDNKRNPIIKEMIELINKNKVVERKKKIETRADEKVEEEKVEEVIVSLEKELVKEDIHYNSDDSEFQFTDNDDDEYDYKDELIEYIEDINNRFMDSTISDLSQDELNEFFTELEPKKCIIFLKMSEGKRLYYNCELELIELYDTVRHYLDIEEKTLFCQKLEKVNEINRKKLLNDI